VAFSRDCTFSGTEVAEMSNPTFQAYQILHFGFTVAPIIARLDKFFHLLVHWDQYLLPFVNNLTGGHQLMLAVGVIEIVADLGIAFKHSSDSPEKSQLVISEFSLIKRLFTELPKFRQ
jgi:hypothetical protein